ncbi:MAG: hypothetical protein M1820_004514 [Bogoriella megaspora]|nr:MAG: hypothetical protein M1820_004514 [Bogoriella megaspora]
MSQNLSLDLDRFITIDSSSEESHTREAYAFEIDMDQDKLLDSGLPDNMDYHQYLGSSYACLAGFVDLQTPQDILNSARKVMKDTTPSLSSTSQAPAEPNNSTPRTSTDKASLVEKDKSSDVRNDISDEKSLPNNREQQHLKRSRGRPPKNAVWKNAKAVKRSGQQEHSLQVSEPKTSTPSNQPYQPGSSNGLPPSLPSTSAPATFGEHPSTLYPTLPRALWRLILPRSPVDFVPDPLLNLPAVEIFLQTSSKQPWARDSVGPQIRTAIESAVMQFIIIKSCTKQYLQQLGALSRRHTRFVDQAVWYSALNRDPRLIPEPNNGIGSKKGMLQQALAEKNSMYNAVVVAVGRMEISVKKLGDVKKHFLMGPLVYLHNIEQKQMGQPQKMVELDFDVEKWVKDVKKRYHDWNKQAEEASKEMVEQMEAEAVRQRKKPSYGLEYELSSMLSLEPDLGQR